VLGVDAQRAAPAGDHAVNRVELEALEFGQAVAHGSFQARVHLEGPARGLALGAVTDLRDAQDSASLFDADIDLMRISTMNPLQGILGSYKRMSNLTHLNSGIDQSLCWVDPNQRF
jgi:hypothetical protein